MAKATVKDGTIFIEVPFSVEGSVSKSRKSIIHATTEQGTPDALTIEHGLWRLLDERRSAVFSSALVSVTDYQSILTAVTGCGVDHWRSVKFCGWHSIRTVDHLIIG